MAENDLLNEEDFFPEEKKESVEAGEGQRQELPEDDLFSGMPVKEEQPAFEEDADEDESSSQIPEEPEDDVLQDFSEDVQVELELDEIPAQDERSQNDYTQEDSEYAAEELPDYVDDKQEKISYKPFIIGATIIALLVVVFIALKFWVFTDEANIAVVDTEQPSQAVTKDPNQPSPEEIKRAAFYKTLNGETKQALSSLSNVASAVGRVNKVSSILMYGEECLVEAYCKNRAELAKLNMEFKQNAKGYQLEIISSSTRPGTSGGILGLFRLSKASAGDGSASAQEISEPFKTSDEAVNWLKFLAQNNTLFIKDSKTRALQAVDDYNLFEIEASISGGVDDCLRLIDDIASAGKNLRIHKLNLTAVDQRKFSPKKYQLRMILKIYV